MLRLRTLGGLSLDREDAPKTTPAATAARRRLAVLAVIAASGERGIPRDRLLALLWPESELDRARHALDQTLYVLKRDAGGEPLVLGREELTLNPATVSSDLGDFRAARARGDHAEAVKLYGGPFLDGVYLSGAAEFEHWVDAERQTLMRDVASSLEALAAAASSRGDHREAAEWWQRLAAMDRRKTRVVVALMSELAASGDRAAALRHAEVYRALVQDDLGAEPNPVVAELAERLRREPADIGPAPTVAAPAPAVAPPPLDVPDATPPATSGEIIAEAPAEPARPRPARARRIAGVAVALAAAVAVWAAWAFARTPPVPERAWVVLADVENRTGDSIYSRALDVAVASGLQQSAYVNVLPRSRVRQALARTGRAPSDIASLALDESLAREVAQREGARAVVVGAIDRVDSSYMLSARVVDAASGEALAAATSVARSRAEVVDAVDRLVRGLRRALGESRASLVRHDRPLPQATTSSLEALRKYADGAAAYESGEMTAGMELWRQAVALDSGFAIAHSDLGAAYYFGNDRQAGDRHFERALQLLDRLTDRERLQVRATVAAARGDRDGAIALWRSLLAEYPDDPTAWGHIGYQNLRLGRDRDAIAAYNRQLERDSTNANVLLNLATVYLGAREYESALRTYRRAFALQPSLFRVGNINHEYGRTLVLAGRPAEARAAYDSMQPGPDAQRAQGERSIGMLLTNQGRYGEAITHLRRAVLLSQSGSRPLSEARNRLFVAAALLEKGRQDSADAELRAAHAIFRRTELAPAMLTFLGKALVRGGRPDLATEVLDTLRRRAQPANPEDQRNLALLDAEVALAKGPSDSALQAIVRVYAADSGAFVLESLAHGMARAGRLTEAAELYERLAAARHDWYGWEPQPYALLAFARAGELHERSGDVARARSAYQRFLSQWPESDRDLVTVRAVRARLAGPPGDAGEARPVNP